MAWTTPRSWSTGEKVTAAIMTSAVKDNQNALHTGAMALASQAIGDLLVPSSTTQLGRLAAVAAGQVLVSAGTGAAPAWSASPTVSTAAITSTQTTNVPLVLATNSSSAVYTQGVHVLTASMGTSGHSVGVAVGTVHNSKNTATFGFGYAGAGSDLNFAFIGGHSNDDALKVYMNGEVETRTNLVVKGSQTVDGNLEVNTNQHIDGDLGIDGALSKGSGSFRIRHPLPSKAATHDLVHSFIEGPQADLIYRGTVTLAGGAASVNLDSVSDMSEGTFVLLCRSAQCFTSNETGWSCVRGSVAGNILTVTCEDGNCSDIISWLVVAERQDQHMLDIGWTHPDGKIKVEVELASEPAWELPPPTPSEPSPY